MGRFHPEQSSRPRAVIGRMTRNCEIMETTVSTEYSKSEKRKNILFWSEFFGVGFASFPGVALRVGLSRAVNTYNYDDTESYSSYMDIFQRYVTHIIAYADGNIRRCSQPYLCGNILGCFIMALLFSNMDRITKRFSPSFYKLLTTGFCGCITTFASWMNSASSQDSQSFSLLVITVEFALTWCAFLLGFMFGEAVHHPFFDLYSTEVMKIGRNFVAVSAFYEKFRSVEDPNDPHMEDWREAEVQLPDLQMSFVGRETTNYVDNRKTVPGRVTTVTESDREEKLERSDRTELLIYIVLFAVVYVVVLSLVVYLNGNTSSERRSLVDALLCAPFGAWLRWYLARIDRLKQLFPTMNPHTFVANMVAVVIQACLITYADSWDWTAPICDGFTGSLSTVSTFFVELVVLYGSKGPGYAIRYGGLSFLLSLVLIAIVRSGS